MLEPTLLLLLYRGPAHGYSLLEQLSEFGLDGIDPSIVYRALRDMERYALVTSTWDREQTQGPPRRVYSIAEAGSEVLAKWVQELDETRNMIDRLLQAYRLHVEENTDAHH